VGPKAGLLSLKPLKRDADLNDFLPRRKHTVSPLQGSVSFTEGFCHDGIDQNRCHFYFHSLPCGWWDVYFLT